MRSAALLLAAAGMLPAQQYRAFWADAFHAGFKTPAQVDQMLDDLAAARANAVFAEVRRRGDSYYLRSLEPPADDPDYAPSFDALAYLVERAKTRGIEVHAWFPVTPAGTSTNPAHVWTKHGPQAPGDEMWMTVNSRGQATSSLDPGHPAAARYLADVILEPARWYDVDGLHLDYIRYPEDADYGYNPTAIARFQRLRNKIGQPAANDPEWAAFRRDQVTALVRQIYLRAWAIRPSIKISGALITWGDGPANDDEYRRKDAYSRVFQDWRGWLEEGILDLGMPMNYFREGQLPTYFDRWIEFEKDRQYRRATLIGPAIYLNSISESMAQLRRALAPSRAGNSAAGVCFYSYASTNVLNAAGAPSQPNAVFYRAAGEAFGAPVRPPTLSWKTSPSRAHVYGTLRVEGGPLWLNDGADVFIESDTGGSTAIRTTTDGTGFFGAVDLPPDRYRVRLERGGTEIVRLTPRDVRAGEAGSFDFILKAEDFGAALPRVTGADQPSAAPGSIVTLDGAALGSVGETQVLANGVAAAVLSLEPNRASIQLPWTDTTEWSLVIRRRGMESAPFRLAAVPAAPRILGVVRRGEYLEVYATGLGRVSPAPLPGAPGVSSEPYNRVVSSVGVRFGEVDAPAAFAGLQPMAVGRYQVNVRIPDGVEPDVIRLTVGGVVSPPYGLNTPPRSSRYHGGLKRSILAKLRPGLSVLRTTTLYAGLSLQRSIRRTR